MRPSEPFGSEVAFDRRFSRNFSLPGRIKPGEYRRIWRIVVMARRKVTAEDLLRIRVVGEPRVSPDGRRCVFTVKTIDAERNRYLSHLWMADLLRGEVHPFTSGEVSDATPRWSPDGTRLAFVRTDLREKRSQIWLIRSDGGEAWPLTRLEEGSIGGLVWSPDGTRLAFTFRPLHPDWTQEARKRREEKGQSNPPRVITRLFYRLDGAGFLDLRQHIWMCDSRSGQAWQITDGDYDDSSPVWSPDGRWLAFVSNRSDDPEEKPYEVDIWLVATDLPQYPVSSFHKVPTPVGSKGNLSWSPDGRWIAYMGIEGKEDPWVPRNARLWVVDPQTQQVRCLTEDLDRYVGNVTLSDMREAFAGGGPPLWGPEGDRLFFTVSDRGNCHLYQVFLPEGAPRALTQGEMDLYAFDADGRASVLVLALSRPSQPGELFLWREGELQPLTDLNREWREEVHLSEPEEVWFESFDGTKVQGWLLKPPDFDPNRRYPLLLYIHGGPHAQYGNTFFHEFQFHAARGYVVMYCNPRGSTGYEEAFAAAIRGQWGEVDYKDVMAAADYAASLPYVDARRMAVAGGSYGGYLTNWIVGHTDRFRCAVADRSVVNLQSMAGTSDFPFHPDGYWEGNFWDRPERLWAQSPLRFAAQVRTPLLIIHSEGDLRCPIGQAEEWFAALRRLKKEVVFVRYPAETSHGLSRSGPPDLRVDRLQRIAQWLDQHLQ